MAVITRYIQQLLKHDLRYAPFTFVGSEKFISEEIEIQTSNGNILSRIGGIIDRLDQKDNILRIVDYKTGGKPDTPPSIQSLFVPNKKRSNYVFQTFLYAGIVCRKLQKENKNLKVAPSLLFIHQAASEEYSPVICLKESRKELIPIEDFALYENTFRQELTTLLEAIFNPDIPFTQTDIQDKCSYCNFKTLCNK